MERAAWLNSLELTFMDSRVAELRRLETERRAELKTL
jgi:hypothetical protein